MDGQISERRHPMFQVRNFLSVTGSFLKRIIAASTIAAVVSISTMVIGISLMAMAGVGGSLIIDGSQAFQSIDGFGVNANSASWKNGELRPAIDMLVDQLGATIFRVVVDNADWETINDNGDPNAFNWTSYNGVYTSPKFEALWSTMHPSIKKAFPRTSPSTSWDRSPHGWEARTSPLQLRTSGWR
jgi:hypothetical protein